MRQFSAGIFKLDFFVGTPCVIYDAVDPVKLVRHIFLNRPDSLYIKWSFFVVST